MTRNAPGSKPSRVAAPLLALAVCIVVIVLSLFYGRYPKPGFVGIASLRDDPMALTLLTRVRLPRVGAAVLAGATLAVSGAAFQMLFSNPLVDAGFLGISQGASFGAALAMASSAAAPGVYGLAFAGGMTALGAASWLARKIRFGGSVLRLVLSGIAVASLFSAAVAFVKYTADPSRELPDIMYWMMGGLSGIRWQGVAALAVPSTASIAVLVAARWRIAILSLDEAASRPLARAYFVERGIFLAVAALGASAVTAAAGPISWVGLVMPHSARVLLGGDDTRVLPLSALLGATFMVFCDTLARSSLPGEFPLGIATAAVGTVLFVVLLLTRGPSLNRRIGRSSPA